MPVSTSAKTFAVLLMTTAMLACDPVSVEFTVPVEDSVEVQGAPLGGLLNLLPAFTGFTDFDLSSRQEFENNNVAKENVEEVLLERATLTVTAPEDGDLGFIDELTFFIESPAEQRQRVASADVPNGVEQLDLDIDDINLAPYVRDESMTVTSDVSGQQPEDDTTIKVELVFLVRAVVDQNLVEALASTAGD